MTFTNETHKRLHRELQAKQAIIDALLAALRNAYEAGDDYFSPALDKQIEQAIRKAT